MQKQVEEMEEATKLALQRLEENRSNKGYKTVEVDPAVKCNYPFNSLETDDELLRKHKEMLLYQV